MRLKYDLHIHTALSPCSHKDMTPNNIVNMAIINQLDIISITDHNSCKNLEVIINLAKKQPIIIIPGMEIETREEIHVLCYFFDLESVYIMQNIVYEHLPNIDNKSKVFGDQLLFDEQDEIIGNETRLLLTATSLSLEQVLYHTNRLNGIMIPAHIDRPSYSIISNLGMIPQSLDISTIEISRFVNKKTYKELYKEYNIIQSSDAHDLGYIGICQNDLDVENKDIFHILNVLKCQKQNNK